MSPKENVDIVGISAFNASSTSSGSSQSAAPNSPTQDQSTSTTSALASPPLAAIDILSLIASQSTLLMFTDIPVLSVNSFNKLSDGTAHSGTITLRGSVLLFEVLEVLSLLALEAFALDT